jgi:hypothetical protein
MSSLNPLNYRVFPAFVLALMLAAAPMGAAQAQSGQGSPEDLLEEGTKKILRAFELFILTIPQYEMPEVLPNGDIIIRRKNPPEKKDGDPSPESGDKTKT